MKELLGKQPRPTKNNRCRLAILAQKISRKVLEQSEHIVTVDSFRRWHRELIAETYTGNRKGRPRIGADLENLIVKMAIENESWGEDSIRDRLTDLGFSVSDRTISRVLIRNGISPSPEREKNGNWEKFIKG